VQVFVLYSKLLHTQSVTNRKPVLQQDVITICFLTSVVGYIKH